LNLSSQIQDYVNRRLWAEEASGLKRLWLEFLQIIILACRGLVRNRSWLQAASLSYATILALIPLLALLFAILKSLGIQRLLASHLMDRLAPGAHDFAVQIINYIEGTKVTSLGIFGVIWLLAALVILMTTIEQAFNTAWQVAQTRPWRRKLSDYLSIFLLFPILMAVAISLSSGILSQPHLRRFLADFLPGLYFATSNLLSLGLLWVAFTFIYLVMPYTRVQLPSALLGGIVGGSLWQLAHLIFAMFQGAATYYNAIYGALYHLLFLVIWMFWSWLVVLFGTEVAHAHQNLELLRQTHSRPGLDQEPVDEYLALAALVAICTRFAGRQPLMTPGELNLLFSQDSLLAARIIKVLKECRLVLEMAPEHDEAPPRFVPAMPLEQISVKEVLACLRAARGEALLQAVVDKPGVAALLSQMAGHSVPSPWDSLSLAELAELSLNEPKRKSQL
jgi:membrane protein